MDAKLETADDVINSLGGTTETAKLLGSSAQVVTNWRARGGFPPETYLVFTAHLTERGFSAPPELWRMRLPPHPDTMPGASGAGHSNRSEVLP